MDLRKNNQELATELANAPGLDREYTFSFLRNPPTNDPERLAAICELAAPLAGTLERRIALMSLMVYATRNGQGLWDAPAVQQTLKDMAPLVAQVEDPAERNRLELMRLYHAGLIGRQTGHFDEAAQAHEKSELLQTDPVSQAISAFCARLEWTHDALFGLGDQGRLRATLANLRAEAANLRALDPKNGPEGGVDGTSNLNLVKWQDADVPCHLIYAHILAGEPLYDGWEDDLARLRGLGSELAQTYRPWLAAIEALVAFRAGELTEARTWADEAVAETSFVETRAIGLLVLARIERHHGRLNFSNWILRQIVDTPCHGAHYVRCVARRELAALSTP